MKLDSPSRFTSFYESFSDLIFATMAIFVLLMMVFLTLIKSSGSDGDLKQKLQQYESQIVAQSEKLAKAKFERDKAREQLQELTQQLTNLEESVRAQGLELVIAVDVSGSMGEALGHLVETIITIGKVLPKITPDFRVGIVAYRQGANDREPLHIFQLQQIVTEEKDGARSYGALKGFLGNLKASNGIAPIGIAVDKAIGMLSSAAGYDGYQAFLLLGDVGPYEVSSQDMIFTPQKKKYEVAIINKISNWVNGSEKRRIISLFSGSQPDQSMHQAYHVRHRESRRFFKDVATKAGQPDNFTENPGKMLAYLLSAIVKDR